ncbi:putative molybdopterin-guanine dinucleotide biosynthesis protein b [hydrocarbon metagenome]|uniref:Putative molybdopterin-guanine dinucleotide biosynthesis protein b n=1 Tax=hydrocarbon metagenome TaxID=938273 RepID=A0A0W8G832_9ZZZZ
MKAIQIVGYKKSGKTSLALELAATLAARGLAVSAAKFTHNPSLDKADTDTARLAAHCRAVAAFTPAECAVFWSGPRFLHDVLPLLDADILVVEGGKELAFLPRVLVLRDPAEAAGLQPGLALAAFGEVGVPGLPHLRDVAAVADLATTRGFLLPGLDCGACGEASCGDLAARIVAGEATPADCQAVRDAMRVTVGGVPLAMNPFVERILSAGIKAMLSQLKGYAPGRVEIGLDA